MDSSSHNIRSYTLLSFFAFAIFMIFIMTVMKVNQNRRWKLGQQSAICWNYISASVWKRISLNLTNFQLIRLIQTIFIFIFSIGCLIELKICKVLWNSF